MIPNMDDISSSMSKLAGNAHPSAEFADTVNWNSSVARGWMQFQKRRIQWVSGLRWLLVVFQCKHYISPCSGFMVKTPMNSSHGHHLVLIIGPIISSFFTLLNCCKLLISFFYIGEVHRREDWFVIITININIRHTVSFYSPTDVT